MKLRDSMSPEEAGSFACTTIILLMGTCAVLVRNEQFNSVAIVTCTILTIINILLLIPGSLYGGLVGKFIFLSAILVSFWLGAWRCMRHGYVPQSGFVIGELSGWWKPEFVSRGVFYIATFQCIGMMGYTGGFLPEKVLNLFQRKDRKTHFYNTELIASMLIILMLVTLFVRYGGSIGGLVNGLLNSRCIAHNVKDMGLLMNFVWFGYYGIALGLAGLAMYSKIKFGKFLFSAVLAIGMLIAFADGTRHRLLYIFAPISLILFQQGIRLNRRRLRALMVTVVILFLIYQCQSLSRDDGWRNIRTHSWADFVQLRGTDQFETLSYAIELVPERHEYFHTPVTLFFITHWIPRRLWDGKQHQPELEYLSSQWTGGATLSEFNVTPSIIGQYHMNWGIFGVAWIGFFMGWMFKCLDSVITSLSFVEQNYAWALVGMLAAFLLASFRLFSPMYFMYPLFGLIIFMIFTRPSRQIEYYYTDKT